MPSSPTSFPTIPSTKYRTTGSLEVGYVSILNTTETDTVNTTNYCCRANLVANQNIIIRMIKATAVEVIGMLQKNK